MLLDANLSNSKNFAGLKIGLVCCYITCSNKYFCPTIEK